MYIRNTANTNGGKDGQVETDCNCRLENFSVSLTVFQSSFFCVYIVLYNCMGNIFVGQEARLFFCHTQVIHASSSMANNLNRNLKNRGRQRQRNRL